jgi:hypothetical protein
MAIVVLVLWLFTAGAGFYLLVTSNLGRARPAGAITAAGPAPAAGRAPAAGPAPAAGSAAAAGSAPAGGRATASVTAAAAQTAAASSRQSVSDPAQVADSRATPFAPIASAATPAPPTSSATQTFSDPPISKREMRRAVRDRFDPPSLTAAKNAPVVPGLRSLLEFAHPACAIVGLGFWLGYTFVHYRALGWIGFALVTVTACLGLSWLAANARAAGRQDTTGRDDAARRRPEDEPRPSFSPRLVAVHGGGAVVTFVLAALTIFVLNR